MESKFFSVSRRVLEALAPWVCAYATRTPCTDCRCQGEPESRWCRTASWRKRAKRPVADRQNHSCQDITGRPGENCDTSGQRCHCAAPHQPAREAGLLAKLCGVLVCACHVRVLKLTFQGEGVLYRESARHINVTRIASIVIQKFKYEYVALREEWRGWRLEEIEDKNFVTGTWGA